MRHMTGCILASFLLFSGCNSGGGAGGAPMGRVFLKDAPAEDLDNFMVTISNVSLVSAGGTEVSLFSGAPVTVDLLDLHMLEKLIAAATLPPGTYTGINLTVTAISATAKGVAQTVILAGGLTLPGTIHAVFEHPLNLAGGKVADISIDIDVAASITDGGGNTIVVQPVALAEVELEAHDTGEVEGKITAINTAAGTFTVVSDEDEDDDPAGSFTVQVTANTLFELDDTCVQGTAGFASLAVGMKVEVKGTRNGSTIIADKIEFEGPGSGGVTGLRVEGLVTALGANTATIAILNVKSDSQDLLQGLSTVTVDLSQSPILQASRGGPADLADIDLGEKILVQGTMPGTSLVASSIFLDRTRFRGIVVSAGSGSLTVGSLEAERIAVGGLSSRTFVVPSGTPVEIEDAAPVALSSLVAGQEVRVKAVRDASTDQWVALQVEVEGGEIEGTMAGVSGITATSFIMTGDGSELGLGNPTTLTVTVTPATKIALVQGTSTTLVTPANLAATLNGLAPTAKIKVEGILVSAAQLQAAKIVLKP